MLANKSIKLSHHLMKEVAKTLTITFIQLRPYFVHSLRLRLSSCLIEALHISSIRKSSTILSTDFSIMHSKSSSTSLEHPSGDHWKVFNSANARLASKIAARRATQGKIPSYEEFIAGQKAGSDLIKLLKENLEGNLDLGYMDDDDEDEKEEEEDVEADVSSSSSSSLEPASSKSDEWTDCSSGSDDTSKGVTNEPNASKSSNPNANKMDDSWDSPKEPSNHDASDRFMKKLSAQLRQSEKKRESYSPRYTSLMEYMVETEPPTRLKPRSVNDSYRYSNLKLSAECRLPLLDVLDRIEDINKVLKAGELTPSMERIIEYKQDHPFQEGYEEDELGCCPLIVYNLEKLMKRFLDSQWPWPNYKK